VKKLDWEMSRSGGWGGSAWGGKIFISVGGAESQGKILLKAGCWGGCRAEWSWGEKKKGEELRVGRERVFNRERKRGGEGEKKKRKKKRGAV